MPIYIWGKKITDQFDQNIRNTAGNSGITISCFLPEISFQMTNSTLQGYKEVSQNLSSST